MHGDGAGQRDPLLLATGQTGAPLADDGVVFFRQALDKVVRSGNAGAFPHTVLRQLMITEGDIAVHGVREQEHILRGHTQSSPELLQLPVPHVGVVHQHRAAGHVVAASQWGPLWPAYCPPPP